MFSFLLLDDWGSTFGVTEADLDEELESFVSLFFLVPLFLRFERHCISVSKPKNVINK